MPDYTNYSSEIVDGYVESSSQGRLLGSFSEMPTPTANHLGSIVLYIGEDGTYASNTFYMCVSSEGTYVWQELTLQGDVDLASYYTKTETDSLLEAKADVGDVYTKEEVYTKAETDSLAESKADADDVYSKTEMDTILAGDGTIPGYSQVQRLTVTGNGTSTSLTASHSLDAVPAVIVFDQDGKLYFTDTSATATDVTLTFNTAPSSGTTYTLVVIG